MEQVKPDIEVALKFCSEARLAPYIQASHGDEGTAITLCKWNHEFAGTIHQQIGYVEIAVRNTIDRSLRQIALQEKNTELWTLAGNEPTLVFKLIRSDLESARRRAYGENKTEVTHNDITARCMWGTWLRLIGRPGAGNSLQQQLWEGGLHTAFPNVSADEEGRQKISRNLCYLRDIRNRAAHFDNLTDAATHKRHVINASLFLLNAIDANFTHGWFDPAIIRYEARKRDAILSKNPRSDD